MISRYKEIELDDAEDGMVLCTQVLDHQGGVLLPKGALLTDALINSLRRRGIDAVHVVDMAVSEDQLAEERERVRQRLAELFRVPHAGAAGDMLREQMTAYRLNKLQ